MSNTDTGAAHSPQLRIQCIFLAPGCLKLDYKCNYSPWEGSYYRKRAASTTVYSAFYIPAVVCTQYPHNTRITSLNKTTIEWVNQVLQRTDTKSWGVVYTHTYTISTTLDEGRQTTPVYRGSNTWLRQYCLSKIAPCLSASTGCNVNMCPSVTRIHDYILYQTWG